MADIYTSAEDERLIDQVLYYGFRRKNAPKYTVLRLAFSKSLRMATPPDRILDNVPLEKGKEYALKQVTGLGKKPNEQGEQDFDNATRLLLSTYHQQDLFEDDAAYHQLLQRHIRRGLYEISTTWNRSHDFFAYLQEELFNPLSADTQTQAATDQGILAQQLQQALAEMGIRVDVRKTVQGARLDRHDLFLENLDHFDIFKRSLSKLALSLGIQASLFYHHTDEQKIISLDIPRKAESWHTVSAAKLSDWANQQATQQGLPVWLGQNVLGEDFDFDLEQAPHLLIAGATGSGKSICLHALLCSLLWTQTPDNLQLALIDPKHVDLAAYQKLPNLFGGQIVHQIQDCAELLDTLVAEMERRSQILHDLGVRDLREAHKKQQTNLPRIVLVVEEMADLLMQSKELETPLVRLAQKARATGIHLVLATQRPDANTFSGLLRSNISGRIALRVQKASESRIILDEMGAEKLLGKGDMLVKTPPNNLPIRAHGAYVSRDDIQTAIRHFMEA